MLRRGESGQAEQRIRLVAASARKVAIGSNGYLKWLVPCGGGAATGRRDRRVRSLGLARPVSACFA
jgi:hypothetical protein